MKQPLLIFFLLIILSGCNTKAIKDAELHNLMTLLTGKFSNEEQVANDTHFSYLNLVNTKIWKDRPGDWLYSEVFDAKEQNYVYSQRILSYERVDSTTIKSISYKILSPNNYLAGWKNPQIFENLTIDSLVAREGCDIYYKKKTSTIYSGKTKKGACASSIDYIDYILSTFVVSKNKMSVWTRGYDTEGKQVWGKIKGPYKYQKLSE